MRVGNGKGAEWGRQHLTLGCVQNMGRTGPSALPNASLLACNRRISPFSKMHELSNVYDLCLFALVVVVADALCYSNLLLINIEEK